MPMLKTSQVEVYRGLVPHLVVHEALYAINFELSKCLKSGWKGTYDEGTSWFPTIRDTSAIVDMVKYLPEVDGELCDPQILLGFPFPPHKPVPEIFYHLDKEPEWAKNRKYLRIAGVALTPWHDGNGTIQIKDYPGGVTLLAGDVITFAPDVWHASGVNQTPHIRYGVYFRWVEN